MEKIKSTVVLLGLILGVTMASCTTTRVATLTKGENETLELFTTKLPDRGYIEISYIQTDGMTFHTPQQLLDGLKKKAVEIKADAVINIKFDFQGRYPFVSGTAIQYTDN